MPYTYNPENGKPDYIPDNTRVISNDPITQRLQLTKIAIDNALETHQMTLALEHYLAAESDSIEQVLKDCGI